MTAIGPRQRAALDRLKWRSEIAAEDDRVFVSLRKLGLATSAAGRGGHEWRITFAGCCALRIDTPEQPEIKDAA